MSRHLNWRRHCQQTCNSDTRKQSLKRAGSQARWLSFRKWGLELCGVRRIMYQVCFFAWERGATEITDRGEVSDRQAVCCAAHLRRHGAHLADSTAVLSAGVRNQCDSEPIGCTPLGRSLQKKPRKPLSGALSIDVIHRKRSTGVKQNLTKIDERRECWNPRARKKYHARTGVSSTPTLWPWSV